MAMENQFNVSRGNVSSASTSRGARKYVKKKMIFRTKKPKESEKSIIEKLQESYENIDATAVQNFTDFPLSQRTIKGLKENGFTKPTEIQRESIALGLRGQDILGAAKTGSGKTLAFLIPIIENLFCQQWTRVDGVGALVITPTRELAYQIFETLRKIGIHHDISAGLIIGGKDLQFEKRRMDQCNIIICTPGRLLQHMDENPLFDCNNMRVLVLDEADRCLDMGFEHSMNAIIENLPAERQTLLFSATQTKSVRDLARLSLKDPMYVSVHENSEHSTPEALQQSYIVCELSEKMSMLWSFVKNHSRHKILVFMSSCKQVKYHYDLFCRLRPNVSVMQLQGTLHQLRRMAIYEAFCKKSCAVLFATDIAARGLDFPEVNWVVQLDCPEDANTYIHRAGRTARYQKGGESLLVLLPSEEEGMMEELKTKKIPISKIKLNPSKLLTPSRKIEALLAQDSTLKESAQRAFVAYVKSVFMMKNKNIFDVHALDTDSYSASLGLALPPRIRFLQRLNKKMEENTVTKQKKIAKVKDELALLAALKATKKGSKESSSDSSDGESEADEEADKSEEETRLFKDPKSKPKQSHSFADESDSDDDVFQVKRKDHELEETNNEPIVEDDSKSKKKALTKAALAKKILKKKIVANTKIMFDEEGTALVDNTKHKVSDLAKEYEAENKGGIDITRAREVLIEEDRIDKQRFKERMKAKRREVKRRLKLAKRGEVEEIDEEVEEEDRSDDGSGPDLSWLPDPDKIYGKKESGSDDELEVEAIHKPIPLKRKSTKTSDENGKKKKLKSSADADQPLDTGLSLMEDEELALQFLKNVG